MSQGKQNMSREDAARLYDTLKQSMESKFGKQGLDNLIQEERVKKGKGATTQRSAPAMNAAAALSQGGMPVLPPQATRAPIRWGQKAALILVVLLAGTKIVLSGMEVSGYSEVAQAQASMRNGAMRTAMQPYFSKEEVRLLQELDSRRVELEKRSQRIDNREIELKRRDREFASRLTEMRELTQRLQLERKKVERKRDDQLGQLANVYGSMNPKEAAGLIEQLDVTIAKKLVERMPEKRIGQILAMMSPDRALTITKMLSATE